jgi:acetate kinase
VTGILNGAAIGTSMGMSPQSGLPQNNRVGDLDAEAIPYVAKTFGITVEEAQRQLCKESGLKGLSGVSNDIREVQAEAAKGNAAAQMALDVFFASTRHWIGSFFFELNGADAIVFTAGIGENRPELRAAICANLDQLGIVLDPEKNNSIKAQEGVISADHSRVKILVIPTNEELVVAREVKRFLENKTSASRNAQNTARSELSTLNQ